MFRVRRRLAAIGTGIALAVASGLVPAAAQPAPARGRPGPLRTYLIHLIDGGDPIVVQKYTEEAGQIRFEKYGGWVSIPSYEVLRIVPDDSPPDSTDLAGLLPPAAVDAQAPLYVTTRSGAALRATQVGAAGSEVRVRTPEGSLTLPRADLVGVVRVPAPPGQPEAWITLWNQDGDGGATRPAVPPELRPPPPPALSNRPHLLQLASGVVIQVDSFWLEGGEIRFRRLGGVVGFALGEIARLLPQEVEPVRGRLAARFIRRLGPDRLEVRLGNEQRRVRLIGVEPVPGAAEGLDDPWAGLDRGLLVHLEFDRERSGTEGDWLAYLYLPSGRMLNAELIRVGLARPRSDGRNLRYLDLFEELGRKDAPPPPAP